MVYRRALEERSAYAKLCQASSTYIYESRINLLIYLLFSGTETKWNQIFFLVK